MALNDMNNGGNGFYMPVAPAYGYGMNGYGNSGFGFGGDGAWWLLLLVLLGGGMWGGFGMGGFGGMMGAGMMGMDFLYPWLNNSQHISDGFRDQQLQTSISSIGDRMSAGFADVQLGISGLGRDICQTGNGITAAVNDGFSRAEIAANGRQMANMQQLFGIQTTQLQSGADTRMGIADLKYANAAEAAATRAAGSADAQRIIDKLCQLEIDGVRRELAAEQRENANLRSDLMYARGQASQVEQTAQLRANAATVANQLVSELRSCPIPAQPVYGNQPIFQCAGPVMGNGNGCGCNGNGFGFAA